MYTVAEHRLEIRQPGALCRVHVYMPVQSFGNLWFVGASSLPQQMWLTTGYFKTQRKIDFFSHLSEYS